MTKQSTFSVPLEEIKHAENIILRVNQHIDKNCTTSLYFLLFTPDLTSGVKFGWKMRHFYSDDYTMGLSPIKVRNIITKYIEKYPYFDISIADYAKDAYLIWEISYTNHNHSKIIPVKKHIKLFGEKKLDEYHSSHKAFYNILKREKQKQN